MTEKTNDWGMAVAEACFMDECILGVTVRTTGFKGGDAGHGGQSEIVLRDTAGFSFDGCDNQTGRIVIRCAGDAELRTLSRGLVFAGNVLLELAKAKGKP